MVPRPVRRPILIPVVRSPFPLVTDVIDDIGNVELPTMVALHDLDVADIIGGENSGNCRCLRRPEEDK